MLPRCDEDYWMTGYAFHAQCPQDRRDESPPFPRALLASIRAPSATVGCELPALPLPHAQGSGVVKPPSINYKTIYDEIDAREPSQKSLYVRSDMWRGKKSCSGSRKPGSTIPTIKGLSCTKNQSAAFQHPSFVSWPRSPSLCCVLDVKVASRYQASYQRRPPCPLNRHQRQYRSLRRLMPL